jgi:Protein of unknown function (DUF2797)
MEPQLQILSGYGFEEQQPYFVVDVLEKNKTVRKKIKIIGNNFTIQSLLPRYCVGRYDLLTFDSFPCPNAQLLSAKENICYDCFKFNSFNPSFYNMPFGQLSIKQRAYNLGMHHVYLAYFSKSHIKVGISHQLRNHTRWLEQGARIATVIYKCENAYDAREIEEKISGALKLSESFRGDQKRQLLKDTIVEADAAVSFDDLKNKIEIAIHQKPLTSEYVNLDHHYLNGNKIQQTIIDVSNELPLIVSGTGVGLIGDTLLFENSQQQFMVSLKKIISHEIQMNDQIVKQKFTPLQISLF